MRYLKKRPHLLTVLIALMFTWVLSGCGKDAALETYKQNMEVYFQGLSTLNDRMNAIDPEEDQDGSKLLECLDQMNSITSQMADLEVPEQFSIAESLADEASENLSQAVELYHELYASDEYSQSLADGAYEYYSRANLRIGYIRSILQGNVPDDLEITEDDTEQSVDSYDDGSQSDESDTSDEYTDEDYTEVQDDALQYLDVED